MSTKLKRDRRRFRRRFTPMLSVKEARKRTAPGTIDGKKATRKLIHKALVGRKK